MSKSPRRLWLILACPEANNNASDPAILGTCCAWNACCSRPGWVGSAAVVEDLISNERFARRAVEKLSPQPPKEMISIFETGNVVVTMCNNGSIARTYVYIWTVLYSYMIYTVVQYCTIIWYILIYIYRYFIHDSYNTLVVWLDVSVQLRSSYASVNLCDTSMAGGRYPERKWWPLLFGRALFSGGHHVPAACSCADQRDPASSSGRFPLIHVHMYIYIYNRLCTDS